MLTRRRARATLPWMGGGCAAGLLALATVSRDAGPPPPVLSPATVWLERLTHDEARARVAAGWEIVLPTGGVEYNGPHVELGKHDVLLRELCTRIGARTRRCARPSYPTCRRAR